MYCKKDKSIYMADLIDYDKSEQRELVHLLSMFEVAFTAKQRKNYLFYCLMQLFENRNKDAYLKFVRNLADKYFFDVYLDAHKLNERNQPKPNSFDETIIRNGKLNVELEDVNRNFNDIYPKGTSNIPLFVFNYTDYRLWKKYADELRGNRAKKGSSIRECFFAPWDVAISVLILLTISISQELAKVWSITILRQKLVRVNLSAQRT